MVNQCFMIEVFSGTATLCSVAKQYGLDGSLALDEMRKKGARATIFVFNILDPKDSELCITGSSRLLWFGFIWPLFVELVLERGKSEMEGPGRHLQIAIQWAFLT